MQSADRETWSEIRDHSKYLVSNRGVVMNHKTGRILLQTIDPLGVHYVGLLNDHTRRQTFFRVSNLVWQYFIGPIPDGTTTRYVNGDTHNNAVRNLDLVRIRRRSIIIWDKETNATYNSVRETSRGALVSLRTISTALCTTGARFEIVE